MPGPHDLSTGAFAFAFALSALALADLGAAAFALSLPLPAATAFAPSRSGFVRCRLAERFANEHEHLRRVGNFQHPELVVLFEEAWQLRRERQLLRVNRLKANYVGDCALARTRLEDALGDLERQLHRFDHRTVSRVRLVHEIDEKLRLSVDGRSEMHEAEGGEHVVLAQHEVAPSNLWRVDELALWRSTVADRTCNHFKFYAEACLSIGRRFP